MAKTLRNEPKNAKSSDATATLMDFERRFPDDASCLDWLVGHLYPSGRDGMIYCPTEERETKHYRVKSRTCFECQHCGHQEYPMRGTIFEGSSTSLRLWFYAIYLMASTRCGISAKQLEREVGVSYPTAHRMFKQIRTLLIQDDDPFSGTVEADEAYFGGMGKWKHHQGRDLRATGRGQKSMVLGMAERGPNGARISATVADPKTDGHSLAGRVSKRVLPSAVFTDEAIHYWGLAGRGYAHQRVNHQQNVYVSGDVHTNTIEGFWSLVKRGISGTYHGVSSKYLQHYLDEYVFRYNSRENPIGMFDAFLSRISKTSSPASPDPA
jgi:transposase-like protein